MFRKIKKKDTLIICGDFGFIWDSGKKEQKVLKWLGKRRYDVLFADGVNENFTELEKYPIEDFCGGKTRKISGKLRHLMRGYVFYIADKRVLAFGGGENLLQQEDFDLAKKSLEKVGNKVDYIISHEPPTQLAELLTMKTMETENQSYFLDEINRITDYERWFFGKHHINKIVANKYFALFDNIVKSDYDPTKKG